GCEDVAYEPHRRHRIVERHCGTVAAHGFGNVLRLQAEAGLELGIPDVGVDWIELALASVLEGRLFERTQLPTPVRGAHRARPGARPVPDTFVKAHIATLESDLSEDNGGPIRVPAHDRHNVSDRAASERAQVVDEVNRICEHPVAHDRLGMTDLARAIEVLLVLHVDETRPRIAGEIVERR